MWLQLDVFFRYIKHRVALPVHSSRAACEHESEQAMTGLYLNNESMIKLVRLVIDKQKERDSVDGMGH